MRERSETIISGLRRTLHHLPRRRRWQSAGILMLMFVGALAELLSIGAVVPLLALFADPQSAGRHRFLGDIATMLGARSGGDSLWIAGVIFAALAILTATVRIFLAWASQKFIFLIGYDLGTSLYKRVLHQPYSFHVRTNSSKILATISNIQRILTGMLLPLMQGLTALIISAFIMGGLLVINTAIALTTGLGFAAIYIAVSVGTRRRLRRNGQTINRDSAARIKAIQEGLGGIRDVLLDGSQAVYVTKFMKLDRTLRDAQAANALITVTPRFVVESLSMVMIVAIALIMNYQEGGLANTLPALGALALGAQRLLPLLQQAFNGWTSVMSNRSMFFAVLDLLDEPLPPDALSAKPGEPLSFEKAIHIDNVSFQYGPNTPLVLRSITFDIPKGARLGFIGQTGSGKSTLLDLIMGLLEPTTGQIRIDDTSLVGSNVAAWQMQVAHVPQAIFLADTSILENVALGIKEIDEARVRDACVRAGIHAFIEGLAQGYETTVGERGVRLSGGQRQRIGIARALYKRSTVLVLDEATSALDDTTEANIMESVERLGADVTILMIAHRLTTLRDCDRIYRLAHGRIVEQGTYDEVVAGSATTIAAEDKLVEEAAT